MNRTTLFGEGLFETIRWEGENEKLKLHYERLSNSARFFGYPCPSFDEFLSSIKTAVGGGFKKYVKFLLMFNGPDAYFEKPTGYETRVVVKELPPVPRSVSLTVSPYRRHSRNPLNYHKTTSYLLNVLVKREARARGYFDGVLLNEKEYITECSASNLIILKGGKLYTPARESGLLWGTTLEMLLRRGVPIKEEFLEFKDLREADAVFVCNSLMGVVPVESVEGEKLPIDFEVLHHLRSKLESGDEGI